MFALIPKTLNNLSQLIKPKIFWILSFLFLTLLFIVFLHPWYKTQKFVILLKDSGFFPASLTVHQGDEVVFQTIREDSFWPASDPHPLHNLYPNFDAGEPIKSGKTWIFKASKLGSWNYHDHLYPAFRGTLNVVPRSETILSTDSLKRSDMEDLIDKIGPESAYEHIEKIYANVSDGLSHTATHLFGEVLYSKTGPSGISVCDSAFGFGCFHGFFLRAVSDKGVDMARTLDKECVEKFGLLGLGCPHGIGHGLGELFGPEKLGEQLAICKTLSWQGPIFGCSGGVFMEHNFPTGFKKDEESTVDIRQPVNSEYYEPCTSVNKEFKESCYFEQASWWREIFHADYKKIGEMCNAIANLDQKTACLEGIGDIVASTSDYSLEVSIEACNQMPSRYSESLCRTGVAWAFFANPSQSSNSEKVCEGLGNYESLCLNKRMLVGS